TLNAFMMQPLYERLRRRYRRSALAAALSVVVSSLGIIGTLAVVAYLLVGRGVVLTEALIDSLSPGGALRQVAERVAARAAPLGIHPDDVLAKLRDAAAELAAQAAQIAAAIAAATFSGLLALFFVLMTTYFVLRNWSQISRRAEDMLPL